MPRQRWLRLFILAAALLVGSQSQAQETATRASHRLDLIPIDGNPDDLLRERRDMKRNEQLASTLSVLKKFGMTEEDLVNRINDPKFRENISKMDWNSPTLRQMIKGMGMNPEDVKEKLKGENLDRVSQQLSKPTLAPPEPTRPDNPPQQEHPAEKEPPPEQQPERVMPGQEGTVPLTQKEADTGDRLTNSPLGEYFESFASKIKPEWRNSPAAHRFVRALTERMGEKDGRWGPLADGASTMVDKIGQMSRATHLDRLLPANWSQNLKFPSMPTLNVGQHLPSLPSPGPVSVGASGPAAQGGGSLLWTIVGLAGLAVLIWAAGKRYPRGVDVVTQMRRQLGPWPVNPGKVASREELIRAFEYLSVLQIGPAARNWNHRHIAKNLGGGKRLPTAVTTAERLATLYERARYTPADEDLPADALAEARRGLCAFAGVNRS
jgi:hypothetical protein